MVDRLLRMSPDHRYGTELHVYLKDAQGLYIHTGGWVGASGWNRDEGALDRRAITNIHGCFKQDA